MSDGKDNEMWQRIEDAFTPNSDEFKRTERELARVRLEQDARLRDDDGVVAPMVRRRSRGRIAAMVSAAALVVTAVAWTSAGSLWPEPLKPLESIFSVSFLEAEQKASSSSTPQMEWEDAISYMVGGHRSAVTFLANIAEEENAVGRAAKAALTRFADDAIEVKLTDERGIKVFAFEALDGTDEPTRLAALRQLEAFLPEAERVVANCDTSTERRANTQRIQLNNFAKTRRKVIDGTLPTYIPPRDGRNHMREAKPTPFPAPKQGAGKSGKSK